MTAITTTMSRANQRVSEALGLIENDFDAHAQLHYLRS